VWRRRSARCGGQADNVGEADDHAPWGVASTFISAQPLFSSGSSERAQAAAAAAAHAVTRR
jgi:hypothetical protein